MNPKKRLILFLTFFLGLLSFILLPALVNDLSSDPNIKTLTGGMSTGKRVSITVIVFIVAALATYLLDHYRQASSQLTTTGSPEDRFEKFIRGFFNSLKVSYHERHTHKLDGRFEIPLEAIEIEDGQNPEELIEQANTDAKARPASDLINDAFERNECLLLLAGSGVGKTVLLLNFAIKKLRDTDSSERRTFPIIFNLASWSRKYTTAFEDWLVSALTSNGALPEDIARKLLQQERTILLLDGLDELGRNEGEEAAAQIRADCLESLNNYLDRGRFAVICCSVTPFAQMQKAKGQDAPVLRKILLMSLTREKIEDAILRAYYREDEGRRPDRISADNLLGLLKNEVFLEVLRTPFYFTTALEVFYQTLLKEKDLPAGRAKLETYLIEKFVGKKLEKTPNEHNYPREKTLKWLKWLAEFMQKKPPVVFELSHLQPGDLSRRWIYYSVASYFSTLPITLIAGVALFIIIRTTLSLIIGLAIALIIGLVPSLLDGLVKSLEFIVKERLKPRDADLTDYSKLKWRQLLSTRIFRDRFLWQKVLAEGLVRGLGGGLTLGIVFGYIKGLAAGLFWGIVFCLVGILTNALPKALKGAKAEEVISTEGVVKIDYMKIFRRDFWKQNRPEQTRRGVLGGLSFGLFAYLMLIPLSGFDITALPAFAILGVILGYLGGMGLGLVSRLQSLKTTIEPAKIETPYQRLRGGGFTNLMFLLFLLAVAVSSAAYFINSDRSYSQTAYVFIGAYFLVLFVAVVESVEVLSKQALSKHIPLRIALYFEDAMPLRYAKFLDYAADLRILEKDGGQWRFRHQNLQKYFGGSLQMGGK